ncbi:MAG: polynucleotide adenylyltransferase PcnB [Gammaproteobacteria bacterium]|nr:polynucleotide adenylyltransferase PcnB [Gammaproteobacteria bacterium]MDH5728406.1 polynucleotide adenylyltransferase PcnB [Gammaproteobacteria bacterium]
MQNPATTQIPRAEHSISRADISENALKVLYRLKNAGYEAYLVGGGVRDLLLGRKPKDFDISTDATPEDVRKLFRNCRLIGRRFRLAHVHFGPEIIEVATFRGQHDGDQGDEGQIVNGMIVRDNVYGTLEEDAWRRDFSINSLYYNIADFAVIDFVGGVQDLKARQLRLIGDPVQRYREDPVRMLRAVRFAAKLDFNIEEKTEVPLTELGYLLEDVPPARLFEEILKLFLSGAGAQALELLRRYNLFGYLFPQTESEFNEDNGPVFLALVEHVLRNTDQRIAEDKSITPAFLLSAFLWGPVSALRCAYAKRGMSEQQTLAAAADKVISGQNQRVSMPRRFHPAIREIWNLQDRFAKRAPKRSLRLLKHPRFRAAYDFLLLRAEVGEVETELAQWWTDLYEADEDKQKDLLNQLGQGQRRRRRRKRKPE